MFRITDNKGFQITFANGWTASVQFGAANYCDNSDINYTPPSKEKGSCPNCEIAAWNAEGTWYCFPDGDTVEGWKTADEVAAFINKISNM